MEDIAFKEFVERVRAGSSIVDVVQSYVPLKREHREFSACCPFHNEKTPSFHVSPDKGVFYCFGCHAGGDVFKFISLIENISWWDAVKMQAEKLGIEIPKKKQSPEEERRQQHRLNLVKVNSLARDFFHNCLTMTNLGKPGKEYFFRRGITAEIIEEFSLGFAPIAWDKLTRAFKKRGISESLLLEAGLAQRRTNGNIIDFFRARVIIPIADERGRVVAFGGRVLDDSKPKYRNTADTLLFNKRQILFGLDRSKNEIRNRDAAIIVEGYMDAIAIFAAGVKNVVAALGTAFTQEQAKLLLRYTRNFYLCFDSDLAGQKANMAAITMLNSLSAEVRVVIIPDAKDADEFIRKNGTASFENLLKKAVSAFDYCLRFVLSQTPHDTLEGKVRAMRELFSFIAAVKDRAKISEYTQKISQSLFLDESVVAAELNSFLGKSANSAAVQGSSANTRTAVSRQETAIRRAGRIIIAMAWKDLGILAHAEAMVPIDAISDKVQREILLFLKSASKNAIKLDEIVAASQLSEETAAELSRALIEDFGDNDKTELENYTDSLLLLRKEYLSREFARHSRLATSYRESGEGSYQAELLKANEIKKEMETL